jgi:cation diffusion facilitator family transporter
MSHGGGGRAIVAALGANVAIALAKTVGAIITGSSSMAAEAVHSFADSGNQVLLLVGGRRAARDADDLHPFGHGRERYFFSFVVALVIFSLGALFAVYEGIHKISHPAELDAPAVAIGILLFAIVAEGYSFRTAVKESRPLKGSHSWWEFIRVSKQPELPVVLLEDLAALIGLMLALMGVTLTLLTGDGIWDGIGTLSIGLLLGTVAAVLGIEMKSLLIGESASRSAVGAIAAALVDGVSIKRVIHLKTMHLGPDELLVAAKIAVEPSLTLPEVALAIDAAEVRVRAAEPLAVQMYLEPDLDRTPS